MGNLNIIIPDNVHDKLKLNSIKKNMKLKEYIVKILSEVKDEK